MEDEVADVRSAEVHQCVYLRIRDCWPTIVGCETSLLHYSTVGKSNVDSRITAAERDFNHVRKLSGKPRCRLASSRLALGIGWEVELRLHPEMDLVLVEFVVFSGVVLNVPKLHASLRCDDRRRVVAVEEHVDPRRKLG